MRFWLGMLGLAVIAFSYYIDYYFRGTTRGGMRRARRAAKGYRRR